MRNINIDIGNFDCSDPNSPFTMNVTIGTTYRQNYAYYLNYSWNSAMYDSLGMTTDVIMRNSLDGQPFEPYLGMLPDNASNFQTITFPLHDTMDIELEFQVNGRALCFQTISIPYSSIVNAP